MKGPLLPPFMGAAAAAYGEGVWERMLMQSLLSPGFFFSPWRTPRIPPPSSNSDKAIWKEKEGGGGGNPGRLWPQGGNTAGEKKC